MLRVALALFAGFTASSVVTAQVSGPEADSDSDSAQSSPATQPAPPYQRPVSLGQVIPNIVADQSKIFLRLELPLFCIALCDRSDFEGL